MEQRFGRDFSRVQVHTGAAAEQSAQDVDAAAYTVGHDLVFASGQFAPGTPQGRRLIAHELTHVVQQSGAGGRQIQRKAPSHPRDRCDGGRDFAPCAGWSTARQRARLDKHMARAADDDLGRSVNTVAEIQLDHKLALTNGGAVYDFDNLQIVSPRFHGAVGER